MDWLAIKDLLKVIELSRGRPDLSNIYEKALAELNELMSSPEEEETEDEAEASA